MKIPLKMGTEQTTSDKAAQAKAMGQDIAAAKQGDWNAKNKLVRTFMPLFHSLAEKRSTDPAAMNKYIEAAKEGMFVAIKKFDAGTPPERFQVFALDYIESEMNAVDKKGGFFARLFRSS